MTRNSVRINIDRREPFAGGTAFGEVGPYERLLGTASYAIDPDEPGLPFICDLDLAPRNGDGMVEFSGTVDIVKPVDLERGNRRVLYEFSNRGGRAAITGFNFGRSRDFTNPESVGDGFLMRQGYTVVWSGWQGDLIDRGFNCVAYLPEALQNGQRLRGKVREISKRVNRSKATVPVKVEFADAESGALPDMSARVSFLDKPLDQQQLAEKPKTIVEILSEGSRKARQVATQTMAEVRTAVHLQPSTEGNK